VGERRSISGLASAVLYMGVNSRASFFYVHVTVHRYKFLCNKNQLVALISQIYFAMKLYMFRTVPLSIIRSLFTVHPAMVYVLQVCRQPSSSSILVLLEGCLQTCMTYTSADCTVNKLLMMDRGTVRNM